MFNALVKGLVFAFGRKHELRGKRPSLLFRLHRRAGFFLFMEHNQTTAHLVSFARRGARWLLHRKKKGYVPVVGISTTIIASENVLFLKEWLVYHKLKGVTKFFIYDNSESQKTEGTLDETNLYLKVGTVNKYGIPYNDITGLDYESSGDLLRQIAEEVPGVEIIPWSPRDENGVICYRNDDAKNDILARMKREGLVDWLLFIDTDEYMIGPSMLEISSFLEEKCYDGAVFTERRMASRWSHMDKWSLDIDESFSGKGRADYWDAVKTLASVERTAWAGNHRCYTFGRKHEYKKEGGVFFFHYNLPSGHDSYTDQFSTAESAALLDPELVARTKAEAGDNASPQWRMGFVTDDGWRESVALEPLRTKKTKQEV